VIIGERDKELVDLTSTQNREDVKQMKSSELFVSVYAYVALFFYFSCNKETVRVYL